MKENLRRKIENRIKVGYDLTWFPKNKTGVAFYIERLIRTLYEKYNATIDIYLFVNKYSAKEFENLGDITVCYVRGPLRLQYLYSQYYLNRIINKFSLDVVHYPFYTYYGKTNAKKVYTVLDLYYLYDNNCLPNRRSAYYWIHMFIRNLINADFITAISENTKKDILKFVPSISKNKIDVIYPIINENYKELSDLTQKEKLAKKYSLYKPYILSVGDSSVKRRNIGQLISGYKRAVDLGYNLDLVLVGITKDKNKIIKNGIHNRIHIMSYIHENDLVLLHQCAKYCIVPSLYEGFSYPAVQSMKCDVPVIISNNSCFSEVVGSAGIYIQTPFDDLKITEALIKSKNEEVYHKLVRNCKKESEKFDTDMLITNYYNFYKKVSNENWRT
jgi:glycosyltransferase involved in cell wall biosynthesis